MYIGPERRKAERREKSLETWMRRGSLTDRRHHRERRQEALAGIIAGLTAEDMQVLAALHRASEEGRVIVHAVPHAPTPLTYDEIIAREA